MVRCPRKLRAPRGNSTRAMATSEQSAGGRASAAGWMPFWVLTQSLSALSRVRRLGQQGCNGVQTQQPSKAMKIRAAPEGAVAHALSGTATVLGAVGLHTLPDCRGFSETEDSAPHLDHEMPSSWQASRNQTGDRKFLTACHTGVVGVQ